MSSRNPDITIELSLDEARLNGSRYYTVSPSMYHANANMLVWKLRTTSNIWKEMESWCNDIFGPKRNNDWPQAGDIWFSNNSKFWFKNEADATLFMLKWKQ